MLDYLPRLPRLLGAEAGAAGARRAMAVLGGPGTRVALLIAARLAGLAIALLTAGPAGAWQGFG